MTLEELRGAIPRLTQDLKQALKDQESAYWDYREAVAEEADSGSAYAEWKSAVQYAHQCRETLSQYKLAIRYQEAAAKARVGRVQRLQEIIDLCS